MKIYMAGCGGMLGSAFNKVFSDCELKCTDKDVNESWLEYLDFRDTKKYIADVLDFNPDFLFHLGAMTDLEECERLPHEAYQTNAMSVETAVYIANKLNIPLLYIGTGGVFDGKKEVYDDYDLPNPLGVYARSKYAGERYIIEHCKKYFVCRAGWMFGGGKKDKKFISKILKQLKTKDILCIVNDKAGTMTYTMDFAKNVKELIKTDYYGLYNMVCKGSTNRVEIVNYILQVLNLNKNLNIVDSEYFQRQGMFTAPRPNAECLINRKLGLRNLNHMRYWQDSLLDYLQNEGKDI